MQEDNGPGRFNFKPNGFFQFNSGAGFGTSGNGLWQDDPAITNTNPQPEPEHKLEVKGCGQCVVDMLCELYQRFLPPLPGFMSYNMPKLILVPWYLTEIADDAFKEEDMFDKPNLHFIFVSNGRLKRIGERAFRNTAITTITIPYSVTVIEAEAFADSGLQTIEFEAGSQLEGIDYYAFNRSRLEHIEIPDSVIGLGGACFYNCESLYSVVIGPNSRLQELSGELFSGEELSGEAEYDFQTVSFYSCPISDIFIPDSVKEIGYECFLACESLTKVQFGANPSVEIFGRNAFGCPDIDPDDIDYQNFAWNIAIGLSRIYIPDSVRRIEEGCFSGCPKLTLVSIGPDSRLEHIGKMAFTSPIHKIESCQIAEIYLPNGLKEIGDRCFAGCAKLERVSVGPNFEQATIGKDAFPPSAGFIVRSK